MALIYAHEFTLRLNVRVLSVSWPQWRVETGYGGYWLCVPAGRASQCQRLQCDCCAVVHVRKILVLKCDRHLTEDCGIIGAGIIVDEQVPEDQDSRHGDDSQPDLRNDMRRNSETPQL